MNYFATYLCLWIMQIIIDLSRCGPRLNRVSASGRRYTLENITYPAGEQEIYVIMARAKEQIKFQVKGPDTGAYQIGMLQKMRLASSADQCVDYIQGLFLQNMEKAWFKELMSDKNSFQLASFMIAAHIFNLTDERMPTAKEANHFYLHPIKRLPPGSPLTRGKYNVQNVSYAWRDRILDLASDEAWSEELTKEAKELLDGWREKSQRLAKVLDFGR